VIAKFAEREKKRTVCIVFTPPDFLVDYHSGSAYGELGFIFHLNASRNVSVNVLLLNEIKKPRSGYIGNFIPIRLES